MQKKLEKIISGSVCTLVFGFIIVVSYYVADKLEDKRQLVLKVKSYVEKVDGKPGISFEEQADFLKRVNAPYTISEGEKLDWKRVRRSQLEKALESYKAEEALRLYNTK